MSVLDRFLAKKKISSLFDLNSEERQTYREMERALAGRKLTEEDVSAFFKAQTEDTIAKLATARLDSKDDTFLKVKLQFLRAVKGFLDAPEMERKAIEGQIARQIEAM